MGTETVIGGGGSASIWEERSGCWPDGTQTEIEGHRDIGRPIAYTEFV